MSTTTGHPPSNLFTNVNFAKIQIKEKHRQQGVSTDLLERMWGIINHSLVNGEHGNLWVRLHGNESFMTLCQNKGFKALKYLFPILIEEARKKKQSYVVVESDCHSKVPELARLAGMVPRYMNTEIGCQVNAIRLKEGQDRWPKFRAIKESVSAIILVKNRDEQVFVVLGKNKDNGAGRGNNLGTITGYREPGETPQQAVRREAEEETGLQIPASTPIQLVAESHKQNYYPGADDRNETRVVCINLAEDKENKFELKQLADQSWTIIQRNAVLVNNQMTVINKEIQAADDLAEVFVLPIQEAFEKMNPKSCGLAKVQAAFNAITTNAFLNQQVVSYCWKSDLQSYDDVVMTS